MNRINDIGHYLLVIRSYFFSLFNFLWFKFKRFIQKVFCEKGALKFPKKQLWALENVYEGAHFTEVLNITKEELLHGNFRRALPAYLRYNFFLFNNRHFKNWWHWGVFTFNGWKWGGRKWYVHFKSVRLYIS